MRNLFDSAGDLKALESVRNLFAHQGGRVDQKFKEQALRYDPELRDAALGSTLLLGGAAVARYANSAVSFSVSLLEFVNAWLKSHPD
ncbi:hypothetical protein [Anatilimnocola aggregata]|uniref:hypothetical protein n=1 Tax=Anatilimnocola aggregata TaxID=2528021 RepID=UPI00119CF749|nr:hypothetical protein [Anatilimnocola aggregata]